MNYELWTMNYELWTMNYELWTMNYELWTMDYGLWTMNYELWTMNYELWTMNYELWTMNYELWTMNYELWTMNYELWTMSLEPWHMNYELWSTSYDLWPMNYKPWTMKHGLRTKVVFTLYQIVKRSIAESVPDRASVHTRKAAFEAVSALEYYCSAPPCRWKWNVLYQIDFWDKPSQVWTLLSEQKLQRNLVLVNDLFKSKGSATNCMTDRASVYTGNASEQFLHRKWIRILVQTVPEQLLKWSNNLSGTV